MSYDQTPDDHVYLAEDAYVRAQQHPPDSLAHAAWTSVSTDAVTFARLVRHQPAMRGAHAEFRRIVLLNTHLSRLLEPEPPS